MQSERAVKMLARPLRAVAINAAGPSRWSMARPSSATSLCRSLHSSAPSQSGSNKWSKIKHTKEKNDSKRSTGYSNLSREIIAAVRNHPSRSTSPETNPKLALLIRRAKSMDVSRDKLEATLKKAETMGTAADNGQQVTYEALAGPADNGQPVALIVECQTDSPGRTLARVKEVFNKNNIRLSSTEHFFRRTGQIRLLLRPGATFDSVFDVAVENGAEDVSEWEAEADEAKEQAEPTAGVEVICSPSDVVRLSTTLSSAPHSHTIVEAQSVMAPVGPPMLIRGVHDAAEQDADEVGGWLGDEDIAKLDKVLDFLQENADCTRVWSNIEGWPSS